MGGFLRASDQNAPPEYGTRSSNIFIRYSTSNYEGKLRKSSVFLKDFCQGICYNSLRARSGPGCHIRDKKGNSADISNYYYLWRI